MVVRWQCIRRYTQINADEQQIRDDIIRRLLKAMRTLRLVLEYDGTHFVGWQSQRAAAPCKTRSNKLCTSCSKSRSASSAQVARTLELTPSTSGSFPNRGRAAYRPTAPQSQRPLAPGHCRAHRRRSRRGLPRRYSATRKRYRYRIHQGKAAVNRTQVWTYYSELSLEPMAAAARSLCGEHSFGAFCKQDPIPEHLTCHVFDAAWSQRGPELVFEIEANRFLRHMVRDPRRHHGRNRSRHEVAGGHR